MPNANEDLWVEMSIREIWTQCHFALIAVENIDKKAASPTDQAFSSIHSFLSHTANVSKLLNGRGDSSKTIGQILGVDEGSVIHEREFRNHLEHYDERLKRWIGRYKEGAVISTYNIGPRSDFTSPDRILVSHYDPATKTFTFVDEDFQLDTLAKEAETIQTKADDWVAGMESGRIMPPFAL